MVFIKIIKKLVLIVATIVLLSSSYKIAKYFFNSGENKKLYSHIAKEHSSMEKNHKHREHNLKNINENITGWIKLPNTKIDYPFVRGSDNSFYLDHDINDKHSIHGSIFMDYRNKSSQDKNLVIYGHHMKDGSMFKDLVKYKDRDFFDKNKTIFLDIDGQTREYEIFSVLVSKGDSDYIDMDFKDCDDFLNYIKTIEENSLFKRNIDFQGDEDILTLSTCSYEFNNARTAIYGVKK